MLCFLAFFLPLAVVGCELNVNTRVCKHDVTRFIIFVPVWLFHLSVKALKELYKCSSKQKYVFWSNNILCESHEMSFVHPKHAFMPYWISVQYVVRVSHFSAFSLA